jgi:hypothetical protein
MAFMWAHVLSKSSDFLMGAQGTSSVLCVYTL